MVHQPVLANAPTVTFFTEKAKVDKQHRMAAGYDSNHATVEFFESGALADQCPTKRRNAEPPCQRTFALDYIRTARRIAANESLSKDLVVITFIHGNENNATESSDNYPHFRQMINCLNLGETLYIKQYGDPAGHIEHGVLDCKGILQPVSTRFIGIYVGWRGNTNHTFVNLREKTAVQIGSGADLIPTLYELRDAAKDKTVAKPARFVVFGHSFGGLLLEQTASRIYREAFVNMAPCNGKPDARKGYPPFTDMMVTINPAVNGLPAKKLIEFFQSKEGSFCDPQNQASSALHRPLLLTLVSKNDFWSRPFGSSLRHQFGGEKSCNGYASCADEIKFLGDFQSNDVWQNDPAGKLVFASTAANLTFFQNLCYLAGNSTTPGETVCDWEIAKLLRNTPPKGLALPLEYSATVDTPVNHLFVRYDCRGDRVALDPTSCRSEDAYDHHDDLHIWNRTPYWIGEIDSTIITGHNDFWDSKFVALLTSIIHAFPTLSSDEITKTP